MLPQDVAPAHDIDGRPLYRCMITERTMDDGHINYLLLVQGHVYATRRYNGFSTLSEAMAFAGEWARRLFYTTS